LSRVLDFVGITFNFTSCLPAGRSLTFNLICMLIKPLELITRSWQLYAKNFNLLMKIILWLLIPAILLSFLPAFKLGLAAVPISIFLTLASIILSLWISIVLIMILNQLVKGEEIDLKIIYREGYSKILSYLWVNILIGLVIFFGFFLLIVPGIIFAVWFSMAIYILIFEETRGTQALAKSKELVKNYFWAVLWRWVAPYFVYGMILFAVIYFPIYLIGLLVGAPLAGFAETPPWWANLISNIISLAAMPIFSAVGVLLYKSLKKEKESISAAK